MFIHVWILTFYSVSANNINVISTTTYQFRNQRDCLVAKDYLLKNSSRNSTAFCLQADAVINKEN